MPKSKPYVTCSIFEKKFDSFLLNFTRISMFQHFCDDWAYAERFFVVRYVKFFFLMFTLVQLDGFLWQFFEISIIYSRKLIALWWGCFGYFTKIIACAGSAYAETISSLAEHTRKDFIANWVYAEQIPAYAQPALQFWQYLHGVTSKRMLTINVLSVWVPTVKIFLSRVPAGIYENTC